MPAELGELDAAIRELLAMLADPASKGIDRAWTRCRAAEAELLKLVERREQFDSAERAEIRKGLEGLVRLNAIARQAAAGAQDSLAKSLVLTKRESQTMQGYRTSSESPGASCDVAG